MKFTISIPDTLHERIRASLKRSKMSMSEFFECVATLYLDKCAARAITANLDRVYSTTESTEDTAFRNAAVLHFAEFTKHDSW